MGESKFKKLQVFYFIWAIGMSVWSYADIPEGTPINRILGCVLPLLIWMGIYIEYLHKEVKELKLKLDAR